MVPHTSSTPKPLTVPHASHNYPTGFRISAIPHSQHTRDALQTLYRPFHDIPPTKAPPLMVPHASSTPKVLARFLLVNKRPTIDTAPLPYAHIYHHLSRTCLDARFLVHVLVR